MKSNIYTCTNNNTCMWYTDGWGVGKGVEQGHKPWSQKKEQCVRHHFNSNILMWQIICTVTICITCTLTLFQFHKQTKIKSNKRWRRFHNSMLLVSIYISCSKTNFAAWESQTFCSKKYIRRQCANTHIHTLSVLLLCNVLDSYFKFNTLKTHF